MQPSRHVQVEVNLGQIRANVKAIRRQTGVDLIAVVKADAYGLGARQVSSAIASLVDGFYVFDAAEALAAGLIKLGKPIIALQARWKDAAQFERHHIRPVVWTIEQAKALRAANPVVSLDTGQGRFACPPSELAAIIAAAQTREVMTHAISINQVVAFRRAVRNAGLGKIRMHAAGSELLDQRSAWLDAVRPGAAIYRNAVTVSTQLVNARNATGPSGYTGFKVKRFGLILAGYANGLRPGVCLVNGQRRRILEVGMQSTFVEITREDQIGDVVTLLSADLPPAEIAKHWRVRPQEALVHLANLGRKTYLD